MKKALSIVLAIVLCLGCVSFTALAADTVTAKNEEVTAELTGVIGKAQVIISNYDYETDKEVDHNVTVNIVSKTDSNLTFSVNKSDVFAYPVFEAYSSSEGKYGLIDGGQFISELSYEFHRSETVSLESKFFQYFDADTVFCVFSNGVDLLFSYDESLLKNAAPDEGPSDWAKEEIAAAEKAGIITPHTNSNFRTDINRFQFAELVVNMAEKVLGRSIAPAEEGTFTDCKEAAVLKAYAAGIVNGVGDGKFAPDTTTNREQISTMIARAIKYLEKETGKTFAPASPSIDKFTDKDQVSAWAVDGVGLLAANGIMNGTSEITLSPQNPCTIEQSILLIYRFYQKTV